MKNLLIIVFSFILMSMQCYEPYNPHSEYKPILMDRTILENSISYIESQDFKRPGKLYFKGDTIYVNEKYRGIHVFDNSDPSNPVNAGFITIPGCIDMAVKENILYVDNSVDLLAIVLTPNLSNIKIAKRIRDVFPDLLPPDNLFLAPAYQKENRPENTVIVGWEKIES